MWQKKYIIYNEPFKRSITMTTYTNLKNITKHQKSNKNLFYLYVYFKTGLLGPNYLNNKVKKKYKRVQRGDIDLG